MTELAPQQSEQPAPDSGQVEQASAPVEAQVPVQIEAPAQLEVQPPVGIPSRTAFDSMWELVRQRYARWMIRNTSRGKPVRSRYMSLTEEFFGWAFVEGVTPENVTAEHKEKHSAALAKITGLSPLVLNMRRQCGVELIDEAIKMRNGEREEEFEENEPEETDEDGDESEAPPRRGRPQKAQVQAQAQPVFVVQAQAPAKQRQPKPSYERAEPRTKISKLLPSNEKIRVFKRGSMGKKLYVGDYETKDVGGSLHRFLKDFVDHDYSDPSGLTTYEVFEVDARTDTEKGIGSTIAIESGPQQPPDESIQQARSAVELIRELRELDDEKARGTREVLDEAKKKAAGSSDFQGLMMLMMMERMANGNQPPRNDDAVLKVLERFGRPGQAPASVGDLAAALPMLPAAPIYAPPPPQPPDSGLKDVVTKLLEVQLAPKHEKSFADSIKELAVVREIFAPPPQQRDPEMVAILKLLAEKMAQPPQTAGLEGALATFDKLSNVVTTLAPRMNMGGVTGFLQNVITPEVGKAIASAVAAVAQKNQPAPAAPPPQQAPVIAAPPPPRAVQQPPQAVIARVQALQNSTEEAEQIQRLMELLQEMYGVPEYQKKLEPALQAIVNGDVKPAQRAISELLKEVRKDLDKPDFIDKTIAALITVAGGAPPPELATKPLITPTPEPVLLTGPGAVTAAPAKPSNGALKDAVEKPIEQPPPPPISVADADPADMPGFP